MAEQPKGCARITGAVLGGNPSAQPAAESPEKKETIMTARVGQKAPDQAGNVGRAFGVWDENQGIELRGRFIIDPDGVIQAMEVMTPPVGRRLAETVRQVQAFQHVRASKGSEAMPAGWMPGDPTLKPGPGLVGNVWKVWKPSAEK